MFPPKKVRDLLLLSRPRYHRLSFPTVVFALILLLLLLLLLLLRFLLLLCRLMHSSPSPSSSLLSHSQSLYLTLSHLPSFTHSLHSPTPFLLLSHSFPLHLHNYKPQIIIDSSPKHDSVKKKETYLGEGGRRGGRGCCPSSLPNDEDTSLCLVVVFPPGFFPSFFSFCFFSSRVHIFMPPPYCCCCCCCCCSGATAPLPFLPPSLHPFLPLSLTPPKSTSASA